MLVVGTTEEDAEDRKRWKSIVATHNESSRNNCYVNSFYLEEM